VFLIPSILKSFRHDPLANHSRVVAQILESSKSLREADDESLRKKSLGLRYQIHSGTSPDELIAEAFSLVVEASRRTTGLVHYPVQIIGGLAMHHRGIAVMQTGEGKTLAATLPLYLAALEGKGAHLATANDYLAARDARQMEPVFAKLGLTTGVVVADTDRQGRINAWGMDVTYTTAKEIGFDFLRDRLLLRQLNLGQGSGPIAENDMDGPDIWSQPVLRELNFVLVDEVDSILIDEARTPLIVSGNNDRPTAVRQALFAWSAEMATRLRKPEEIAIDHAKRQATLTAEGRQVIRGSHTPDELAKTPLYTLYSHAELSVAVNEFYQRDRHYIVRDGEIVIVDEFTGRPAEGRRWRNGIHQAIEVREQVEMSAETCESARITLQDLFLRYERMAGMTGTVAGSTRELEQIYRVTVREIPTNRPPCRKQHPDQVFATEAGKWKAIADQVARLKATGQPVLVGTRSIDKSELLSKLLTSRGIMHEVLNARNLEREADLVARAGEVGAVTVATNMAGRGTDIRLDDAAIGVGGLHVICSELHDSARVDRQLVGRCGRQGDPGSWQCFMSLEDDILRNGFEESKVGRIQQRTRKTGLLPDRYANFFRQAQRRIEEKHFQARKLLMYQEQQRNQMQLDLGMDPYLDAPESWSGE